MKTLLRFAALALIASCSGGGTATNNNGAAGASATAGTMGGATAGTMGTAGTGVAGAGVGGTGGDGAGGTTLETRDASLPKDAPADVIAIDAAVTVDAPVDTAIEAAPDANQPETVAMCGHVKCDCTFKGKKLWGKVKYVTDYPYDFTVGVVTNYLTDLYVQDVPVPGLVTRCGQWQSEDNLPAFRVMKVTNGLEDFKIQYVDSLPGLPNMRQ